MAAAPLILAGDLKISDQNNWGGPEQKIKFGAGAKFKGGPKILEGGPFLKSKISPPFIGLSGKQKH